MAEISPLVEMSALSKLMVNWRSVVEDAVVPESVRRDKQTGQISMDI